MEIMLCGTNMSDVKISNRSAILRLLHESGAMSRKQIAARLKLTSATITVIINELISESILVEGISIPNAGAAGRREVLVEISHEKYVALGLALCKGQVKFTAVNLYGEKICEETFLLPEEITPQYFLDHVCSRVRTMIGSYGFSEEYIVGLGIIICGVVDCANGIILDSDGFWNEKNVPIVKMLRQVFPFPIVVANNVRSFANAYAFLKRDPKMQNMLFIRNEATMGAALVLDGRFYDGDRNLSAGIAHYPVVPNGRRCHCGKRGCLDTVASQDGMMASLSEEFGEETTPLLYRQTGGDFSKVTFSMFLEAVYSGDQGAADVLNKAQETFASAVAFAIQLLDVQRVIFHGEMFRNRQFFSSWQKLLTQKTEGSYKENSYRVVPSEMQIELVAAPILAVNFYFNAGGHKNY